MSARTPATGHRLSSFAWCFGLSCILMILIGCSVDGGEAPEQSDVEPMLQAENLEHDFGSVFAGAVKHARFSYVNRGDSDLVIARATKDCGCTKPSFDKRTLAPGESGTMTVTLLAPLYHGQLTKRIRVFTNDPDHEVTTFILKMEGLGKASLSPEVIRFGEETVMPGPELIREFELRLPEGQEVTGVSMNAESPYVKARLGKESVPGTTKIELVFSGLREKVKFRDYLLVNVAIRDAAGKKKTVQPQGIQVNGYLKPTITASRTMIDLGVVRRGEKRVLESDIIPVDDSEIETVSLCSDCSTLKLDTDAAQSAGLLVRESLIIDHKAGRLFATLEVRMKNGASLEIPVMAWVEPRL